MGEPTARRPAILGLVADVLGTDVVGWDRPECGLTAAERWVARLADGGSVFVKAATDPETAVWLRNERSALAAAGSHFAPREVAWLDEELPLLITEDLSAAYWPAGTGVVRWRPNDMAAVLASLAELRSRSGAGLPPLADPPARWRALVEADALVGEGWCTQRWTDAYGPLLITADVLPPTDATALVHGDVRSDNLCIGPDDQVRFVDWSQAGAGQPFHDLVTLLPTLRLEGGPAPSTVLTEPVGLITRQAGVSVARAFGDGDHRQPDWLRDVLRQLAAINLTWVCELIELAPPDGAAFPLPPAGPND